MTNATEKTNNLIYKTSKTIGNKTIYVTIRLNDECKNGHEDFAITGDIYEAGKPKIDRYHLGGGCIHDEIFKAFPEFKIFIDLHLSEFSGIPMYAVANGFYHLKNSSKSVTKEYLRITEEEFKEVSKAENETYLKFILVNLGIVARWGEEAKKAIKKLESLTGNKFKSTATRHQSIIVSEEESTLIKKRIASGYYSKEEILKRAEEKKQKENKKLIAEIKSDAAKEIEEIEAERDVKLYILSKGLSTKNFIYYKHSKEAVFNWLDYEKKVSEEEFNRLIQSKDLPKNITFKLK